MRYVTHVVLAAFLFSILPFPLMAQQAPPPPSKPLLAVMDIQIEKDMPPNLSGALANKIREVLMKNTKYILIDRGSIDIILTEMARGQSGCFDDSCAVQVGQLLSAHYIVTGAVTRLGQNECQLAIQLTEVAKAQIILVASDRTTCDGAALAGAAENVALDIAGVPRTPGSISINSNPQGGLVYIDGERLGQTPFNTKLKPGLHKVIISGKGYENFEQTINVMPGSSTNVSPTLKKMKKKFYQTVWFYSAVGVLVAGGAVAIFAAGGGGDGGNSGTTTPAPTTGTINVNAPMP